MREKHHAPDSVPQVNNKEVLSTESFSTPQTVDPSRTSEPEEK